MKFADLEPFGFEVVGGMVDRKGKNYGRLLNDLQIELTEAGENLVSELREQAMLKVTVGPADGEVAKKKPGKIHIPKPIGLETLDV